MLVIIISMIMLMRPPTTTLHTLRAPPLKTMMANIVVIQENMERMMKTKVLGGIQTEDIMRMKMNFRIHTIMINEVVNMLVLTVITMTTHYIIIVAIIAMPRRTSMIIKAINTTPRRNNNIIVTTVVKHRPPNMFCLPGR